MICPDQPNSSLILVVDDDSSFRALLRFAMEEEGYQVAEAKNGEDCLAQFARLQPNLVLLDAVMPVMDGFICCSQLHTLPAAQHTPILMITVLDDQDSVDQAFAVGATDYVTKPIHWAVLRQRVTRLLQASRSLKQVEQIQKVLQKQNQKEQLFRGITQRLSQSLTLDDILKPCIEEIREFLKVDSASLYHNKDNFTIKSFAEGKTSDIQSWKDSGWKMEYVEDFKAGRVVAISDIDKEDIPTTIINRLSQLGIKAVLIAPILVRGEWWGLLEVAHSHSREWEAEIVDLLVDLSNLIGISFAGATCDRD